MRDGMYGEQVMVEGRGRVVAGEASGAGGEAVEGASASTGLKLTRG
jgi:hypothetical protein